jgi:hypothetical protein
VRYDATQKAFKKIAVDALTSDFTLSALSENWFIDKFSEIIKLAYHPLIK